MSDLGTTMAFGMLVIVVAVLTVGMLVMASDWAVLRRRWRRERTARRRVARTLRGYAAKVESQWQAIQRRDECLGEIVGLAQSMGRANRDIVKTEHQDDFLATMNELIDRVNQAQSGPARPFLHSGYRPIVASTDTTPIQCTDCGRVSDGTLKFQHLSAGIICHVCLDLEPDSYEQAP